MEGETRHRGTPGAERPRERPADLDDDESIPLDDVGTPPAENPTLDDV
ncbi:MAG TPA: hypothetical protein VGN14_16495 [Candidatus Elarobacter sp.]